MSDWIIPCNIEEYNGLSAFTELKEVNWIQSVNYSVNDNVYIYIYISGDVGAIRFKCKVREIDIVNSDIDDSKYGIIGNEEGNNYARFSREKCYSGDALSLEKLRENGLNGNLQGAQRLSGELLSYVSDIDKKYDLKHYTVKEAIWLSVALNSYRVFNLRNSQDINDYSFKAKDICKTAFLFSNGKTDTPRVSQWFNGSHIGSYENYICNAPDNKFRLAYSGEFNGDKEFPESLSEKDILLFSNYELTIGELKTFVKDVYTPIACKIKPGFSDLLKQIIDQRPSDIPANAYTSQNPYFILNNKFCSYINELPFVYPECYAIGKAQEGNTLPDINWNGIRTRKNNSFCSSFRDGIYLAYLYSCDKSSVYLTLNQGCSGIEEKVTEKGEDKEQAVINLLKQNANNISQKIAIPSGFSSCNEGAVDLASDTKNAKEYEAGTIVFKKYDFSEMPNDEHLADDLRQLLLVYQKLNKENQTNNKKITPTKRNYWLINHTWNNCEDKSDGQLELISYALENNCCIMHYEPSLAEAYENANWKRTITQVVKTVRNIKEGDIIILRGGNYIYAYGYATTPHREIDKTITLDDFHKKGMDARDESILGKIIGFSDAPVFYCDYKNLYDSDDEYWAQRIDVDRWFGVCPDGVWKDSNIYDSSRRYIPVNQILEKDGKKLVRLLGGSMEDFKEILLKVHNIVLTGAPGTGKTYLSNEVARLVSGDDSRICKVQFHPSYDYTDFVEGLRPFQPENGPIAFKRKDGIFKLLCKKAKDDPDNNYVLIIDEINRGDISKIFGELFSLIEHDYRGKEESAIDTQYSNLINPDCLDPEEWDSKKFYVPENVYIIGTMNDIDRSVESMDFAIRRRFTWLELKANESLGMLDIKVKDSDLRKECIKRMNSMNRVIAKIDGLGSAYEIGGAYFVHVNEFDKSERFTKLWEYYLSPIIKEYLRGFPDNSKYDAIKAAFDNPESQDDGSVDA